MDTNTTGMGKQIAIWGAIFLGTAAIIAGMVYMAQRNQNAAANRIKETAVSYAQQLNLNTDQFVQDMESSAIKEKLQKNIVDGQKVPILFTPTFFLNGVQIDNPRSPDDFKAILDNALAGKPVVPSTEGNATIPNIVAQDDWVKGNKDSKVIVVEYSDFQCPACAAYFPMVEQVMDEYKDKVAFVYRHFPLTSIHPHAEPMARAAEAAGKQGKFWEMYELIFKNQNAWSR
jgi:protein-disulfide isomerase